MDSIIPVEIVITIVHSDPFKTEAGLGIDGRGISLNGSTQAFHTLIETLDDAENVSIEVVKISADLATSIEVFRAACQTFDHSYTFSDDPRIYRNGENQRQRVVQLAHQMVAEGCTEDQVLDVYNEVVRDQFNEHGYDTLAWKRIPPCLPRLPTS